MLTRYFGQLVHDEAAVTTGALVGVVLLSSQVATFRATCAQLL